MPRKRVPKSMLIEKKSDAEDDDFFFDDTNSNSGRSPQEPQHRNAANARERARMRVLSKAFCRLKTTLPWVPADTKLSKLDTLRLAASYIAHLRALLQEPRSAHTSPHPVSLAWPFAFQHGSPLSCTVSQRWNVNTTHITDSTNHRTVPDGMDLNGVHHCAENYPQDYSENDYEDRNCEEYMNDNCNDTQYCGYGYKDTYRDIRNVYSSSNSLVNNG